MERCSQSPEGLDFLATHLTPERFRRVINYEWAVAARDDQLAPVIAKGGGRWHTWLILGGRGSGKTRATAIFQLTKTYGSAFNPWTRDIRKPVAGPVLIAVAGATQAPGTAYSVDHTTGIVTFQPGHIPAVGQAITAGFEFNVPVRFDTDRLEINLQGFRHGAIPSIPIVEIRL